MIEELVVAFFQRIEEKEAIKSRNGKASFLVNRILDKNEKEKEKHKEKGIKTPYIPITMSMATATRLQEKYIDKKEGAELKKVFFKDTMAKYLGFKDYNDFEERNKKTNNVTSQEPRIQVDEKQPENSNKLDDVSIEEPNIQVDKNKPEDSEPSKPPKTGTIQKIWINYKKTIGYASIPLLGLLYILYHNFIVNSNNCIVWTGYEYEKTTCSTYKAINNENSTIHIETFKKIDVNENTTFFIKGKAIIWYGKNNEGVIEYFTTRGKHPETNKELDKITRYFLNKHSLLNE